MTESTAFSWGLLVFAALALFAMVVMGAAMRSVAGALLGLIVVLITFAILAVNGELGLKTITALPLMAFALVALLIVLAVTINIAKAGMRRTMPDGSSFEVHQTLLGEGATHVTQHFNSESVQTRLSTPSIPSTYLPSGEWNRNNKYLGE